MKNTAAILGITSALLCAQSRPARTFTGVVTDSECATGDHSRMRMGKDDRECTIACVLAHGASYVLAAGRDVFVLDDQSKGEEFAGRKVRVTGQLDGATLVILSIAAVN